MNESQIQHLRSPIAIREAAERVLSFVEANESPWFSVNFARLEPVVDFVVSIMQRDYPSGEIPFHSRWRHFDTDRISVCFQGMEARSRVESALELAIVSVLLDAGAGGDWRYCDRVGKQWSRSEGLAIASFDAFERGDFGGVKQVTGQGLRKLTMHQLAEIFQVSDNNPIVGLEGRWQLLQRLGNLLGDRRLATLLDELLSNQISCVSASELLAIVLQQLSEIWIDGLQIDGINVGDVGQHSSGLVPLHKLSQWLTYSLMEPLIEFGLAMIDLDALTGLAEYRNGGLFIDFGVLVLRDPVLATTPHLPTSDLIVEWRACTIALLDRLAEQIRDRLHLDAQRLPLVKILQGGTWSAGREIARSMRSSGAPPIQILSDGTIF